MSDLVVGDTSVFSNDLAVTQWVLDKVVTAPAENLPTWAAVVYFASPIGIGAVGIGALAGFAVDEVNHYVVHPAIATLETLAEVTGAADGVDSLVNEAASTINDNMDVFVAVARAGSGEHVDVEALIRGRAQPEQPSSAESGQAELHEPAPGGGVLLRPEDAPATPDPEPSVVREPGWGVLLPPEERAQRERAETDGATTRAEAHREPDPPPEPPPTHHSDPPRSQSGHDAETTAPPSEHASAGDAAGPATEGSSGGQAAPEPTPAPPGSAEGAVPASPSGDEQPAPQAEPAGDATPPAEEAEQQYPIAGEASQTAEDGDYPSPEPDNAPIPEARPPEPEPGTAEDAPVEEAEGD